MQSTCWIVRHCDELESWRATFQGLYLRRNRRRAFSLFYTEEDQKKGVPALTLESAARDGRFENEGWRVEKTARASGPLLSSIRSVIVQARLLAFQKLRAI